MGPATKPAKAEQTVRLVSASVIAICAVAAPILHGWYPVQDNAVFEYVGRAIVRGDVLYRDIWDNKLPGVYYANALWQLAFGQNYVLHAVAETVIAFTSAMLLGSVMRSFNLRAWLPASATLMILLCLVAPLNTSEAYALPLLLAAILCARHELPIGSGLLLGIATLFWIPSIFMLLPIAMVLSKEAKLRLVLTAFGPVAIFAIAMAWFLHPNTLATLFRSWVAYVATPPKTLVHHRLPILNFLGQAPTVASNLWTGALGAGALPVFAVLLAVLRKPITPAQRFGVLWLVVTLLACFTSMRFYSHYFIPSLAAAIFTLFSFRPEPGFSWRRTILVVAALVLTVFTVQTVLEDRRNMLMGSTRTARIGSAIHLIVARALTLSVNTYQPGIYLAVDPRLRSPYEIAAPDAHRSIRTADPARSEANVLVSTTIGVERGTRVCVRSAAPWAIWVQPALATRFANCE